MKRRRPVAIFISSFPSPAESFLIRELEALERRGQPVLLVTIVRRHSTQRDRAASEPWTERAIAAPWISGAIFRALWRAPQVVLGLLWWVLGRAILHPVTLLKSLAVLPMAAELAERLPRMQIAHVHAHFATHAATMAVVVSKLSGIPYSLTAHAHAIFAERVLLREKLRDAVFIRTTSEFNRHFLESLFPTECAGRIFVVRVGAAPIRASAARPPGQRSEHGQDAMPVIACVGSHKPHKGVPVFLEACRLLEAEGTALRCLVSEENDVVPIADVVVQPSVIAPNGQMDGIPVPLIDAMAMGKAVIASAISGIPELVADGESGLLVDPANPRMLADAIRRVIGQPALRARLGAAAREKVLRDFSLDACTDELIALFDQHNPELAA